MGVRRDGVRDLPKMCCPQTHVGPTQRLLVVLGQEGETLGGTKKDEREKATGASPSIAQSAASCSPGGASVRERR